SPIQFSCLEFLSVSRCPNLTQFIVSAPSLQELELMDINDDFLKDLELRAPFSASVKVESTKKKGFRKPLRDVDLKSLKDTNCESLDLSYTDVNIKGLEYLKELPLRELSLRGCHKLDVISSKGKGFTSLERLHLSQFNNEVIIGCLASLGSSRN